MRYTYKKCIGKKFNYLTITEEYKFRTPKCRSVKCKCDCGNYTWVDFSNIVNGHIKSCGCMYRKALGDSDTRFYNIFKKVEERCNKKEFSNYHLYGGRGIKCEWKTYSDFKDDMFDSYCKHVEEFGEKETTIDRIDVNGNYCKENCRWATVQEQQNNRRNTRYIEMEDGTLVTIRELSQMTGIRIKVLDGRFCKLDTKHTRLVKYRDIIKDEDIV